MKIPNTNVMASSGKDNIFFKIISFSALEFEFENLSDCIIFNVTIEYKKLKMIKFRLLN